MASTPLACPCLDWAPLSRPLGISGPATSQAGWAGSLAWPGTGCPPALAAAGCACGGASTWGRPGRGCARGCRAVCSCPGVPGSRGPQRSWCTPPHLACWHTCCVVVHRACLCGHHLCTHVCTARLRAGLHRHVSGRVHTRVSVRPAGVSGWGACLWGTAPAARAVHSDDLAACSSSSGDGKGAARP